jgi:hypothetical protein
MYIPGSPSVACNQPTHYEPLWQAAHEQNITLCFHRNHGGPPIYRADRVLSIPART